jgi:hypothetical protein
MSDPLVPRTQMPQIDEKDMAKAIVFFAKAGFGVKGAGDATPYVFFRHQEVNWGKVDAMPESLLDKPILVTRLNEVIDGNHRLAKHERTGTLCPYIQLDCTFVEALNVLAVFPFAYELKPTTPERN